MPCKGYGLHYIYVYILYYVERSVGRGLAPTHGFITHYRTMYKYMRGNLNARAKVYVLYYTHIYIGYTIM